MHNLKTAKSQTLKMHLDRLQLLAESLTELSGGEALARRGSSASELLRNVSALLSIRESLDVHFQATRGPEPAENSGSTDTMWAKK